MVVLLAVVKTELQILATGFEWNIDANGTIMASFQHGFINIAQVIFVDFLVKMIFKTDLQIFTTLSKNKKIYVWCIAALFKKNQNRLL